MKHSPPPWNQISVLCIGMLLAGTAGAFDLMDAYRLALTNDANFLASRATADAAREALPQARAGLLPQLSFSATRSRNNTEQTSLNPYTGSDYSHEYDYIAKSAALSLRQPLFRLGNVAQYYQAKAQVTAAEATLEKDTQQLAVRVAGTYFDTLVAGDKLDSIRTQKEAYTGQLALAERALAAGFGTRTDIDEARARLDMASAQEIDAQNNLDIAERTLASILHQRITSRTLANIDAQRLQLTGPQPPNIDTWLTQAEEFNPELKAIRANIEVAQREVDKGRAAHLPTLDFIASRSDSDSENNSTIGTRYQTSSVGLQLNIPLYSGGQVNSMIRQAQANLEKARQQYEAGRRQLEVMVAREFGGVEQGVARVKALEQALRSAEQALLSTRKGVQAGTRNSIDVLNALQQAASARLDLTKARTDYALGRLRLKAVAGILTETDIGEINTWLGSPAMLADSAVR